MIVVVKRMGGLILARVCTDHPEPVDVVKVSAYAWNDGNEATRRHVATKLAEHRAGHHG